MARDELGEERSAAYELLNRWAEPVMFEHSLAAPQHFKAWWRQQIPTCDLFILLLHRTLRWAVWDELETARQSLPESAIYVFVKEPDLTRGQRLELQSDPPVDEERQRRFYDWVNSRKQGEIDSPAAFAEELDSTLRQHPGVDAELFGMLHKLKSVFVEPAGFQEYLQQLVERRLLFLSGPPHIGKTSTGLMLLERLREEGLVERVLRCSTPDELRAAARTAGAGVLVDDPFGETSAYRLEVADNPSVIHRLAECNWVVVTSREQVLSEARDKTKFGEGLPEELLRTIADDAYSFDARLDILRRHCSYMQDSHYPAHDRVPAEKVDLANGNRYAIVENLQFPHNIDLFVSQYLRHASEGTLGEALRQARAVEQAVCSWFISLEPSARVYACLAALWSGLKEGAFRKVFQLACNSLQIGSAEFSACRRTGASFISSIGPARMRHPSYRDGIVSGSRQCWSDSVARICDALLPDLAEHDLVYLSAALRDLPLLDLSASWNSGPDYLRTASERAHRVMSRMCLEYAPLLQSFWEPTQDRSQPAYWPIFTPERRQVHWAKAQTAEEAREAVDAAIAEGSASLSDYGITGWQYGGNLLSTLPESFGVALCVRTLHEVLGRQDLLETWQMAWCRLFEVLRKLVRSRVLEDSILEASLTAEVIRARWPEAIERARRPLVSPQAPPGTGESIAAERMADLRLAAILAEVLSENGHVMNGPLLVQPDWSERPGTARVMPFVYDDELLISGLKRFLPLFLDSYSEMARTNFAGLADRFELLSRLPADVYGVVKRPADWKEEMNWSFPYVSCTMKPACDPAHPEVHVILFRGDDPVAGDLELTGAILPMLNDRQDLVSPVWGMVAYGATDHAELRKLVYKELAEDIKQTLGAAGDYHPRSW